MLERQQFSFYEREEIILDNYWAEIFPRRHSRGRLDWYGRLLINATIITVVVFCWVWGQGPLNLSELVDMSLGFVVFRSCYCDGRCWFWNPILPTLIEAGPQTFLTRMEYRGRGIGTLLICGQGVSLFPVVENVVSSSSYIKCLYFTLKIMALKICSLKIPGGGYSPNLNPLLVRPWLQLRPNKRQSLEAYKKQP